MIKYANNKVANEYIAELEAEIAGFTKIYNEYNQALDEIKRMEDSIKQLREIVWLADIPHPTIPEYVELHEKMQRIMRFIDTEILRSENR